MNWKVNNFILILTSITLFPIPLFAHGVIESPASREQFCGVESKPDEIFKNKMTHEECRPISTKADGSLENSIYNFMAVLSHTTGRLNKPIDQLPPYVCGFGSEMWGGGKTPWDRAINWPTTLISSGPQTFVWNISWGNHFSDTEEFVYWITKPDFVFDPKKELTWNDFETVPFCHLKYNDQNPNGNPNVVPLKGTNRFSTTCNVPARKNRSVIYAEWGRNSSTYERFHSCIDVQFNSNPTPTQEVRAIISPLPQQVTGAMDLILDGSLSKGKNLSYSWSIDAENRIPYQIQDSQSAKTHLYIANVNAQQTVTVNLTVQQGETNNRISTQFTHIPMITSTWKTIGRVTLDSTLKAGDKIQLRLIDNQGKDYYFPRTPLILTDETAKADIWSYTLAQVVNMDNQSLGKIGVLKPDTQVIEPIKSATSNMIYVKVNSTIVNGYIQLTSASNSDCFVKRLSGSGSYWLGEDIYAESAPFVLDFSATGIDVSKIIVDNGVFGSTKVLDKNRLLISTKPDWVNSKTPGYIGYYGPNHGSYEPFNSPNNPACRKGSTIMKILS